MSSQCRACLSTTSNQYVHLASYITEDLTFFDFFNECTKLQASLNDDYPQEICEDCHNALILIINFIKTAQECDKTLQKALEDSARIAIENKVETLKKRNADFVLTSSFSVLLKNDVNQEPCPISPLSANHNLEFNCQICNTCFELSTQLEQHLIEEHEEAENAGFIALATCEICNQIFESDEILNLHTLIFHQSLDGSCNLCGDELTNYFDDIREHVRATHPVEYAKLFMNFDVTSKDDEEYFIEVQPTDLVDGIASDNADNIEDSSSATQLALSKVEKDSDKNQEKQYLCSFCPREFKMKKSLRQHEKMHFEADEDTVHVCMDCNRQYNTAPLLEQHRKNAHKSREHICKICGNSFKLKNQLNNHLKLHLEKNISCPHCDKRYSRNFDLKVHLRSHTGEMPYECHICEKKFAIKGRLTYHLQKHYGVKHTCKECGATFNSKSKLKAHSFKHSGMPYICQLCDDHGFPNRDVFKRHLLRVHNATITEEDLVAMFQRNTGKTTRIREVN